MSADGEDGGPTRILTEIKLWEVSIVTFPANDEALISSIKQLTPEQWRDLEALLRDAKGLSRADAVKAISGFKEWSQREAVKPMRETRDEISPDVDENAKALLQSLAHLTDKTWAQIF